jgi:hypothetical protein
MNLACLFETMMSRSKTPPKGQYFVTCNSRRDQQPFNIWFSPEQVTSGANLAVPKVYSEAQAREACERAIHANVTHPSTLDLSRLTGYATTEHNNGSPGIPVKTEHRLKVSLIFPML